MVAFDLGCYCARSCCRVFTEVTWPPCYWAFKKLNATSHMLSVFPRAPAFIAAVYLAEAWRLTSCHICYCGAFVLNIYLTCCLKIVLILLLMYVFSACPSQHLFGCANFAELTFNYVPFLCFFTPVLKLLTKISVHVTTTSSDPLVLQHHEWSTTEDSSEAMAAGTGQLWSINHIVNFLKILFLKNCSP